MCAFYTGMRRSSSKTSQNFRGIFASGIDDSIILDKDMKVPPMFEMKIQPHEWRKEDDPSIKPMVWVSNLRRSLLQTVSLAIAAGQHILLDVVVDDNANIEKETTGDKINKNSDKVSGRNMYNNKNPTDVDNNNNSNEDYNDKMKKTKSNSKRKKKKTKMRRKKIKRKKMMMILNIKNTIIILIWGIAIACMAIK